MLPKKKGVDPPLGIDNPSGIRFAHSVGLSAVEDNVSLQYRKQLMSSAQELPALLGAAFTAIAYFGCREHFVVVSKAEARPKKIAARKAAKCYQMLPSIRVNPVLKK